MTASSLNEQFNQAKPGDMGIFGDPIGHSLSPIMHEAAFRIWWGAFQDRFGAAPTYHRFHVVPDHLAAAMAQLKAKSLRGVNITIPHKVAALSFIDVVDPMARAVGAINTVLLKDGRLFGYNTDIDGFKRALVRDMNLELAGKKALVLGAGGTGRVITHGLMDLEIGSVRLWNRDKQKLAALFDGAAGFDERVTAVLTDSDLAALSQEADIIINATSVGLKETDGLPAPSLAFHEGQILFDVIYHRDTVFMAAGQAARARVSGGLGMLVHQGARSFEIWTGAPAPMEIMRTALLMRMRG